MSEWPCNGAVPGICSSFVSSRIPNGMLRLVERVCCEIWWESGMVLDAGATVK